MADKTLVLGLGNSIMTDDGIGPRVIAELTASCTVPEDVELLDGGTLGLDLLPRLEGVQRLILVDAVETGKGPGTVVRLAGDDVPIALETKLSPHQMGMKDLLAVARLMDCLPEQVVLIGMQPECLEMGTELSPVIEAGIPTVLEMVIKEAAL